jgi:nitrite reductase/ring-hydroxylating ferredoxin subunit
LTSGPGGRNYADGVIQCPWHNSRFVVRSGENLDWTPGIAGRSVPAWLRRSFNNSMPIARRIRSCGSW